MKVDVNGAAWVFDDGATLADVLEAVAGSTRGSAVVVDGEVVPRSEWSGYALRSEQNVEVITAVQGG